MALKTGTLTKTRNLIPVTDTHSELMKIFSIYFQGRFSSFLNSNCGAALKKLFKLKNNERQL